MAHLARELSLAVNVLPVAVHAARAAEALAAIDAHVRELAGVLAHVDLQAILVDETEPDNSRLTIFQNLRYSEL